MKRRLGIDYEQLFQAVPGHYIVMQADDPDFTVVEVNDAYLESIHIARDTILNHPVQEVFPGASEAEREKLLQRLKDSVRHCIKTGKPDDMGLIKYEILAADGTVQKRYWQSINFPVMKSSKVVGVLHSIDEVTHQYSETEYRAERIKQLEHLVELNKGKDEFISITSHQLRTPATGVKQYLAMALEGYAGEFTDMQRNLLERAYESNERQLRIINDILKVSQVDSGKLVIHKETVSVKTLVQMTCQDMDSIFKDRSQQVDLEMPDSDVVVECDPEIIRTVLENVLENASKYSYELASIRISLEGTKDDVRISVYDQGVGIPAEKEKYLFQKFNRIDNELSIQSEGTGLGLYWAKRSMVLHDGDLIYQKNTPKGSIFTLILPKTKKNVKKVTEVAPPKAL